MPTIEENKTHWNDIFSWEEQGDEWSRYWGASDMQWYATIFPRIHPFLPAATVLEIAPGFGRWTQFLKELSLELLVVDLSEKCIEACKKRFKGIEHLTYYQNDGQSLAMIPDNSVDFIFSFDSLVHVEAEIIEIYLQQIGKKLKKDGVGFIHHSNLGEYANYFSRIQKIFPKGRMVLDKLKLFDVRDHWRAYSMTAEKFNHYATNAGLECIRQEKINWGSKRLIDCLSIFTKKDSKWEVPLKVIRNTNFMKEAERIATLSPSYSFSSYQKTTK